MIDYYAALGLKADANAKTIKDAYRRLAMLHHPDRGGSHEKMVLINEAFQILFDTAARARYDQASASASENDTTIVRNDVAKARQQAQKYPKEWSNFTKWLDQFVTDWNTADNWKINFQRGACPKCGTPFPIVRIPKSFREAMWGGSTCRNCGLTVDKFGRPR